MLMTLEISSLHYHQFLLGSASSYSRGHRCNRVQVSQKRCRRGIAIRTVVVSKRLLADPTDLPGPVQLNRELDDVVGVTKFGSAHGDLLVVRSAV